ncbi:MAG: phytanoyl-CoA dioxygenase family protein [Acidimicrobiales bacterium]
MAVEDRTPSNLLGTVEAQGWTTVRLLDPAEVDQLRAAYATLGVDAGLGCQPTTIHPDAGVRQGARDRIRGILEPAVRRLLPEHRCVVAAFVPKGVGPDSAMPAHRDWSTCDEERFLPVEVWTPLTAAGAAEGGLYVVPGSHRSAPPRRGSGMGLDETAPGAVERPPADGDHLVVEVGQGEAIVFHPGLLHGSGPNAGPGPRVAVISTFQPVDAPLRHYARHDDGTEVAFEVDEDFYVSGFRPGDPVPGRIVDDERGSAGPLR